MARFFTFAVECYHKEDAVRIGDLLRPMVLSVDDHRIPMAVVTVFQEMEFWYVFANPQGPGYCDFGNGEGLNEPEVIDQIIEGFYVAVMNEVGIRRALCCYEAQDFFALSGEPDLTTFDASDLIYDKKAANRMEGAQDFGPHYYRNPPLDLEWLKAYFS